LGQAGEGRYVLAKRAQKKKIDIPLLRGGKRFRKENKRPRKGSFDGGHKNVSDPDGGTGCHSHRALMKERQISGGGSKAGPGKPCECAKKLGVRSARGSSNRKIGKHLLRPEKADSAVHTQPPPPTN